MKPDSISPAERALVQRVLTAIRFVRDPAFPGLVLMLGLVVVGFVLLLLAWYGAARIIYVALQFPRVISGGFAGVALIGTGAALFNLQMSRRDAAREQRMIDDVLDEVAALMALAPRLRRQRRLRIRVRHTRYGSVV